MRFILTSIFFTILALLPHLTAAAPAEYVSHRFMHTVTAGEGGFIEVQRPNRDWGRPPPPQNNNVVENVRHRVKEQVHESKLKSAEKEVKEHMKLHPKFTAQSETSGAAARHSKLIERKQDEARRHAARVDHYREKQGQPHKYANYNPPSSS
jgi:hypothetical protein